MKNREIQLSNQKKENYDGSEIAVKAVLIIHTMKIMKVICAISIWMKMNICVLYLTSIISVLITGMGDEYMVVRKQM